MSIVRNIDFGASEFESAAAAKKKITAAALAAASAQSNKAASEASDKARDEDARDEDIRQQALVMLAGVRPKAPVDHMSVQRKPAIATKINEDGESEINYEALDRPAFMRKNIKPAEPVAVVAAPVAAVNNGKSKPVPSNGIQTVSSHLSAFIQSLNAVPNEKLGCIDYSIKNDPHVAFRRFPDAISVGDAETNDQIILAMMEMGRDCFGSIEVFGSPEFIQRAVEVAVKNGVVLENKEYLRAVNDLKTAETPKRKLRP